jgi:hypothetical protein
MNECRDSESDCERQMHHQSECGLSFDLGQDRSRCLAVVFESFIIADSWMGELPRDIALRLALF